jgi:hypothetical protein
MSIASLTSQSPHEPPRSEGEADPGSPRRIAVFGSIAAERPSREPGESPGEQSPADTARVVLERVFAEITAKAPRIAQPILDRALAEHSITPAERDELLRELGDPNAPAAAAPLSAEADGVLREALAAIRHASPAIAEPILRHAVEAECLPEAQEQRILERLRSSPTTALRARSSRGEE